MEEKLYKDLEREIEKLKELKKDLSIKVNLYENYIQLCKGNIIDLMKVLKIDNHNGAKKTTKPIMKSLSIENIKEQFLDKEIADLVVCNIDVQKTFDNITLRMGYSHNMAKSILRNLLEAFEYKIEDVEV